MNEIGRGDSSARDEVLVGPAGSVTGVDLDETKLDLARTAAKEFDLDNVHFIHGNASDVVEVESFDYAYARFLLTHLSDPVAVLGVMRDSVKAAPRESVAEG